MSAPIGKRGHTDLVVHYLTARDWVHNSPYVDEVNWQAACSTGAISESLFLREYAWVVLNSGFRETVVRKHFGYLTLCFCDWVSADEIWINRAGCLASAASVFGNRRKLNAIVETSRRLTEIGFHQLKSQIESDPIATLSEFPFLGDVTTYHLAKNLGADVAKPDRHLARVARRFGYENVNEMCIDIAAEFNERVSVVDIVLWRYEACNESDDR